MRPIDHLYKTSADPAAAETALAEIFSLRPVLVDDSESMQILVHLLAGSPFLARWLVRRPEDIDWLVHDDRLFMPRSEAAMRSSLDELLQEFPSDAGKSLRVFRTREFCRICARELSGVASLEDSLAEWTMVADLCLDAALKICEADLGQKHGIPRYRDFEGSQEKEAAIGAIALGKMGGGELNVSSDIDIMFVHSSDHGETAGTATGGGVITLHEYFVRVARAVYKLLNDLTGEGFVFRVDLDLRPEGTRGEVTNSIGALEIYYESWGQMWERQMLLKARYCGGNRTVVAETLDRLRPFVYRKYHDEDTLAAIADMKNKIDAHQRSRKTARNAENNIKLGRGGIREIEFIVQALQLLYAARSPELKVASTVAALDAAVEIGLLSRPHHRDLKEAYRYYRAIENRIQYYENLQTHALPESPERLTTLARQMNAKTVENLQEEVARRQLRVREIFDTFFAHDRDDETIFPASLDDEEAVANWLDSLLFNHPRKSAAILNTLRNGKSFSHQSDRSRRLFDRFGPELVAAAAKTSWPDNVLLGFEKFIESKSASAFYDLLDRNRSLIRLLAALFSSSESLTAIFVRQTDLFYRLLAADPVSRPPDRFTYRREFGDALGNANDTKVQLEKINSFRAFESLRLGLRRILDISDRFELMDGLTILAEEFVRALCEIAQKEAGPKPDDMAWTIMAGGKMGRREMNYGSDLDLMVFYEGSQEGAEWITRMARSLVKRGKEMTPSGAGYEIDLRLRPEGNSGPLVPSFKAMTDYYRTRGAVWERLALVGVRPLLGDDEFGEKVVEAQRQFVVAPALTCDDVKRIADIRQRIVREKTKPGRLDIKSGRGGTVEIEFICQIMRMEHPPKEGEQWAKGPFVSTTLEQAGDREWLDPEVARQLRAAYLLYRAVEDSMRMDRERSVTIVPQEGPELQRLARRSVIEGFGPERFIQLLKKTMQETRELYESFMAERICHD